MTTSKKLLKKTVNDFQIVRFLRKYLEKAGVSSIQLQKTPMATRIILRVSRPGIVAGRKGSSIKELVTILEKKFSVDNPQLDIIEVERQSLDAQLMAEKIGKQAEVKGKLKQIIRFALQDIMKAGAIGAEIRAAGKVVGKGGKAKVLKVRSGYLKKSGHYTTLVRKGRYTVYLKAGAIGIDVSIVPPDVKFPDVIDVSSVKIEEAPAAEEKSEAPAEAKVEEKVAEAKAAAQSAGKAKKAPKPRKKKEEAPVQKAAEEKTGAPEEKPQEVKANAE